jgi:hypothetical protein
MGALECAMGGSGYAAPPRELGVSTQDKSRMR